MIPLLRSSGDLIADRRFDYAEMLAESGEVLAAARLMRDALDLVPGWAPGWFRLGEMAQLAGDLALARDGFRQACALDPEDELGAALRLDLLDPDHVLPTMPPAFVEALFDQYAPDFDHALLDTLDYRAPALLGAMLPEQRFLNALDLGCGTGLMGAEIRHRCARLEGWDISEGMLREAEAKSLYDHLDKRDLNALPAAARPYDLIVAADVFAYLGTLGPVLAWIATALTQEGVLAFTTEAHPGPEPMILRPSRRYAHSDAGLGEALRAAGLVIAQMEHATLRLDRGAPVVGQVVLARLESKGDS